MEPTKGRVWLIIGLVVLVLLGGALIAHGLINTLGDWGRHDAELRIAQRIVWAVWALTASSVILTRVTVFGWSFRRYFRWDG
ncbi:MAG: hypothetical protein ACRC33_24345, partial [Gemmataceae bacterium]